MSETNQQDEYADIGQAPGGEPEDIYRATANPKGGGRSGGGFIWFSCRDKSRDRVLQLANLPDFEPGDGTKPAFLHFSGMDVVLEGTDMRAVAHRIFLGRCSIVYEIRRGQTPAKPGDPVIRDIHFLVPLPPGGDKTAKPKHEPETHGKQGTKVN